VTFDERRARLVLVAAVMIVGLGLWTFVLWGSDGPADPEPGPGVDQSSSATAAPGDPDRALLEGFDEIAITVDPGAGGDPRSWCLLLALTAQQRSRGLMEVTDLQGYSGMVFVYEQDVDNGFYMRNTPTPLSIAWIAADGDVVTLKDMEPCDDRDGCPSYRSEGTYRYAIEVFQGDLDELGITEAATVIVGGACAQA